MVGAVRPGAGYDRVVRVFTESERLILRRFTAADVDLLVGLDSDPGVMRYINGGRPTSREEIAADYLPAFLGYYSRYQSYGFWAALEKPTRSFIGWFHLRPGQGAPADQPELGYRLRRSAWGRGLATEGSRALIEKGFLEGGARRVTATTMAVNLASRRVMEKAGMRLVRHYRMEWPEPVDGNEQGDVEYAIERADWEA